MTDLTFLKALLTKEQLTSLHKAILDNDKKLIQKCITTGSEIVCYGGCFFAASYPHFLALVHIQFARNSIRKHFDNLEAKAMDMQLGKEFDAFISYWDKTPRDQLFKEVGQRLGALLESWE